MRCLWHNKDCPPSCNTDGNQVCAFATPSTPVPPQPVDFSPVVLEEVETKPEVETVTADSSGPIDESNQTLILVPRPAVRNWRNLQRVNLLLVLRRWLHSSRRSDKTRKRRMNKEDIITKLGSPKPGLIHLICPRCNKTRAHHPRTEWDPAAAVICEILCGDCIDETDASNPEEEYIKADGSYCTIEEKEEAL